MSLTLTVKVQVAVLPAASVAVAVTVVVPTGKEVPEAGEVLTVAAPQLSVAVAVKLTLAAQVPVAALVTMLAGQVTVGAWASFTVTVKLQEAVLPEASVAVAETVVVPMPKLLPEAGEVTTVGLPQLSVAVGA